MGSGNSKASVKITKVKTDETVKSNDKIELSKEEKLKKFHKVMEQLKEEEQKCDSDPKGKQMCIEKVNKWAHEQLPQNGGGISNYIAELNIDGRPQTFNITQKGHGLYEAREIQSGGGCGCDDNRYQYIKYKY
ncbi:hypothetical protein Klosneuvirus_1_95 [Klosneuvirus KNV1]|uniref:Uncharacterized protein n=1 Tax=Klosneuvirus KNV1 TaxID=1977640 RepID=A0A1V0SHX5_9VIRU|nr:hypothetical protein Klosneuvirus_1_95 [Klosneuvirus KNV1]